MKLYRYRPLNDLLFKELLYSEIYLASPTELNDPLDLASQVNFYTDKESEITSLVGFLWPQCFVANRQDISAENLQSLLSSFGKLRHFINGQFARINDGVVSQRTLFNILSAFYTESLSVEKGLEEFKAETLIGGLNELIAQFLNNSCVACFSETNADFGMWSQYASGHRGICLQFELDAEAADSKTLKFPAIAYRLYNDRTFEWVEKVRKVSYVDSLSMLSFYDFLPVFCNATDVDVINLSKSRWHPFAQQMEDMFLEKRPNWSSEKEWRIVSGHFRSTMPEDRIVRYHSRALTGVLFGARCSEQTKVRVRSIVGEANHTFGQCKVDGTRGVTIDCE